MGRLVILLLMRHWEARSRKLCLGQFLWATTSCREWEKPSAYCMLLLPTAGIEPGPPAHYSIADRLLRQTFSRRKVTAAVGSWEGRVQATHYRVPNSPRIDSQTVHPADPNSFNDVQYVNSFNWWINLRVLGLPVLTNWNKFVFVDHSEHLFKKIRNGSVVR